MSNSFHNADKSTHRRVMLVGPDVLRGLCRLLLLCPRAAREHLRSPEGRQAGPHRRRAAARQLGRFERQPDGSQPVTAPPGEPALPRRHWRISRATICAASEGGWCEPSLSPLSRCRCNIAQPREPHDGLRRQFLRELHAALVLGAVGIVEIDVRQLFGASQRAAPDLFDRPRTRARCRLVRWRQEIRRQARWIHRQELVALRRGQPLRPGDDVPEQQTFQQRRRCGLVGSRAVIGRRSLRSSRPAGARGATDCRRTALPGPGLPRFAEPADLRPAR